MVATTSTVNLLPNECKADSCSSLIRKARVRDDGDRRIALLDQ